MSGHTVFYGALVTPLSLTAYAALPRALICISSDGDIARRLDDVEPYDLQLALSTHGAVDAELIELRRGEFLLPGFVDTHTVRPARASKPRRVPDVPALIHSTSRRRPRHLHPCRASGSSLVRLSHCFCSWNTVACASGAQHRQVCYFSRVV